MDRYTCVEMHVSAFLKTKLKITVLLNLKKITHPHEFLLEPDLTLINQ